MKKRTSLDKLSNFCMKGNFLVLQEEGHSRHLLLLLVLLITLLLAAAAVAASAAAAAAAAITDLHECVIGKIIIGTILL